MSLTVSHVIIVRQSIHLKCWCSCCCCYIGNKAFISSVSLPLAMLPRYGNSHYGTCDEGHAQQHSIAIHSQSTSRCELALCAFDLAWFFSFAVWTRSIWIECRFNAHAFNARYRQAFSVHFSCLQYWHTTITLPTPLPPTPPPDQQYARQCDRDVWTFYQCSWCM